ncbi:MAG: hypothetical protein ACPL6C_01640, partial [bacterium]
MGGYRFGENSSVEIELERDRLYIGSGGGVLVVDVTDPVYMYIISERIQTPGIIRRIKKISNYLYISLGEGGFEIWNVLWSPSLMSRNIAPYGVWDIAPYLSYIVAVSESGYVYTYYVSSVSEPILSGQCFLSGHPFRVVVKDAVAYVATVDNGIRLVSLLSPSAPTEFSSILDGVPISSLLISGNLLFVGGEGFLRIYNVYNPVSPVLVSSLELECLPLSMAYRSNFLYLCSICADSSFLIQCINVSSPDTPFV